tara:strand:+ start:91 stop:1578 length:1488 start_codon:yes stop_codon:yes gene_type:complete
MFTLNPDITLYPFQREAVQSALTRDDHLLVLPTGGGKTFTSITAGAERGKRMLILTRKTLVKQWQGELSKLLGDSAKVWVPKGGQLKNMSKRHLGKLKDANIILTNFDKCISLRVFLAAWVEHNDAGVIMDEIQYCSNHKRWDVHMEENGQTSLTPFYESKAAGVEHVAHKASWRISMSATPQRTGRNTLWSPLHITFPNQVDSFRKWTDRYCGRVNGEYGVEFVKDTNSRELKAWLKPRSFVVSEEVVEKYKQSHLEMQRTVIPAREQLVEGIREEFQAEMRRASKEGAQARTECLLAEATYRKRPYLVKEVAKRLAEGKNVAIVVNRLRECRWLKENMPKLVEQIFVQQVYEGDMNQTARDKSVAGWMYSKAHRDEKGFKPDDVPSLLIMTEQSAGVGLNLDNADHVFCASLPYNQLTGVQIRGRFSRLSTKRNCVFEYLVAEGTYDEDVVEKLGTRLESVIDMFNDTVAADINKTLCTMSEQRLEDIMASLL